ncbi:sigma-E factor negative regulatory protein [Pseudomarimonas arenosa]|uniref:Sigma-E factor negative regulatory protein n=1 Tax=Pseudomarimonas arenosa TaxID=2774145 RepID=A0AAW3ZF47_9GAMM|nr:sigma-E factor negative regulatory protein [Pseudomarimonas arenosa]MBD8524805.1 sigma-E factor negative regulatory protein [Pseudomarimonas arenosa]
MNEEIRIQLSALKDGELERDAARFLCSRLSNDQELRSEWSRWHLIGDVMNRRRSALPGSDLAAAVAAAIANDATPKRQLGPTLLRWAAGGAIAASVALMALMVVPLDAPQQPGAMAGQVGSQVAPSVLTESDLRPQLSPVTQSVSAVESIAMPPSVRVDPLVEGWVLRHNAVLAQPSDATFAPYLPLVSPYRPAAQQVVVDTRSQ